MRKHIRTLIGAMLLLSTASLSGCEKNETAEVSSYTVPEYTEEYYAGDDRPNIYLVVKNLTSSYWQVIIDGVRDAGKEYNCNIYSSGSNAETEWYIQSDLADIAVSRGADAIVFAPNDSVKLSPKVSEIHNSGVPMILVDTVVNTEDYDICYMTDNLRAGQNAAMEMLNRLEYSGLSESENAYVAIQVGGTSSQTINERLAGFCQYWTKNAPESWKILDEVKCNEGDIDKAVSCAESFFSSYEGIKGVFGCNNGSTVGFARYIKDNELKDISVVGFDYSPEMKELIEDPDYNSATMLQKQYDMGYRAVETALDIMEGKQPTVKFVDTGVVVVNKDSLSDPDIIETISHN